MTSPGITEFLLARIADDEAVANLARPDDHLKTRDHSFLCVEKAHGYAHVAATSGRVLTECKAKRQIVALLTDSGQIPWDRMALANRDVLQFLALPYADHPKYREEWRP